MSKKKKPERPLLSEKEHLEIAKVATKPDYMDIYGFVTELVYDHFYLEEGEKYLGKSINPNLLAELIVKEIPNVLQNKTLQRELKDFCKSVAEGLEYATLDAEAEKEDKEREKTFQQKADVFAKTLTKEQKKTLKELYGVVIK